MRDELPSIKYYVVENIRQSGLSGPNLWFLVTQQAEWPHLDLLSAVD